LYVFEIVFFFKLFQKDDQWPFSQVGENLFCRFSEQI